MTPPALPHAGYQRCMDLTSVLLAPVRVPVRIAQALDDLATIAERARRDPDPVEEVRERIDQLLLELASAVAVISEMVRGGAELNATAQTANTLMIELVAEARSLNRVAQRLDMTGTDLHSGGEQLTAVAKALEVDTRVLIDGGQDLTEVSERIEADLRVFRAAMPKLMNGLDIVEDLEGAVETVADTLEPLQGAADRVGRVTKKLSRAS